MRERRHERPVGDRRARKLRQLTRHALQRRSRRDPAGLERDVHPLEKIVDHARNGREPVRVIFIVSSRFESHRLRKHNEQRVRPAERRKRHPDIGIERTERQLAVERTHAVELLQLIPEELERHPLLFAQTGASRGAEFGQEACNELPAPQDRGFRNIGQPVVGIVMAAQRSVFGELAPLERFLFRDRGRSGKAVLRKSETRVRHGDERQRAIQDAASRWMHVRSSECARGRRGADNAV